MLRSKIQIVLLFISFVFMNPTAHAGYEYCKGAFEIFRAQVTKDILKVNAARDKADAYINELDLDSSSKAFLAFADLKTNPSSDPSTQLRLMRNHLVITLELDIRLRSGTQKKRLAALELILSSPDLIDLFVDRVYRLKNIDSHKDIKSITRAYEGFIAEVAANMAGNSLAMSTKLNHMFEVQPYLVSSQENSMVDYRRILKSLMNQAGTRGFVTPHLKTLNDALRSNNTSISGKDLNDMQDPSHAINLVLKHKAAAQGLFLSPSTTTGFSKNSITSKMAVAAAREVQVKSRLSSRWDQLPVDAFAELIEDAYPNYKVKPLSSKTIRLNFFKIDGAYRWDHMPEGVELGDIVGEGRSRIVTVNSLSQIIELDHDLRISSFEIID